MKLPPPHPKLQPPETASAVVYVVLASPRGFQVQRRTLSATRGVSSVAREVLVTRRDLHRAREAIPAGLQRTPRRDDDVPCIVEVWL